MTTSLPPGQRLHPEHPRFGLPWYAHRAPHRTPELALEVVGPDGARTVVRAGDLDGLETREQNSDFHCVTTWSRLDLRWAGVPFRAFYEEILVPRVDPGRRARFAHFTGVDGYADESLLEDMLADDVLCATRLHGQRLTVRHGGPLRVVAPRHYGYKSVKSLTRIELTEGTRRRLPWSSHHPRGRVDHQERFMGLPGRLMGGFYRLLVLPPVLWWYRRHPRD